MKSAEICFFKERVRVETALTWQVHTPIRWPDTMPNKLRYIENAIEYNPPRPRMVPNKGYPCLIIRFQKAEYWFSSAHELDHFLGAFSKKILPRPRKLSEDAGRTWVNKVWISRVYKGDWKYRQMLVAFIQKSDLKFRELVATLVCNP